MRILISNSSDEPIYTQIKDQIKDQIIRGELDAGAQLPSIRGLAKDLQISVITSKRAYEELEREGLKNPLWMW
jgi:GntR family transcriptional regulator